MSGSGGGSTGQNVVTAWERDERHEELVQTICRYKRLEGKDQPRRDDGEPKALTLIGIRVASDGSGRIVNSFPVRPDTDGADLADELWHFCRNHGKNYELSGVEPTYVLQFHFDRERAPSAAEFPLQFKYQKTTALGTPILDLRDRKNQEAVIVTGLIQADVRRQELFVGGVGELMRGMKDLVAGHKEYNQMILADSQLLRAENRTMASERTAVAAAAADMTMKLDDHKMKNGIKKAGLELGLPIINLLGGQAYKALGEGLGLKSEPFDDRMMTLAKKFYDNPRARKAILEIFEDDEETKAAFALCLQEYERRAEEKRIAGLNGAAASGVMRPMPTGVLHNITDAQIKRQEAAEAAKAAERAAKIKAAEDAAEAASGDGK